MMQIPPRASLSLLSEMFNTTGAVNNEVRENNESVYQRDTIGTKQQQQHPRRVRYQLPDEEPTPPSKRANRRRSPPQKILRSNSSSLSEKNNNTSSSNDKNSSLEERDENGNPQLPESGPITCFSYRTMQKEYEKDTLRMLERIQKSRSRERTNRLPQITLPDDNGDDNVIDDGSTDLDADENDNPIGNDVGKAGFCPTGESIESPLRTESYGEDNEYDESLEEGEDEIFELDL